MWYIYGMWYSCGMWYIYGMLYSNALKLWVRKETEKEKVMAYFRADIYHHVPGRYDVRHDESPSNTQSRNVTCSRELSRTQLRETNTAVGNGGCPQRSSNILILIMPRIFSFDLITENITRNLIQNLCYLATETSHYTTNNVWTISPPVAFNMTVRLSINSEYGNPITFQYCGRQTSFSRG